MISRRKDSDKIEKIVRNKPDKINKNDELIFAKDSKEIIDNKPKDIEKPKKGVDVSELKNEKKHKTKRLFFGLGKEFWRITWPSHKKVLNDTITAIIVMTFFVLLFTGIGLLIGTFIK